jgi:hypothetical protein
MPNNTTKKHSVQKRKSPTQELEDRRKDLAEQTTQLKAIQEALSYGVLSVEQFLLVQPDVDNEPEKAAQILDLQSKLQQLKEEICFG